VREAPHVLHNMSAPPRTTIRYEGLSGNVKEAGPGGSGVCSRGYQGTPLRGRIVQLQLPDNWDSSDPSALLTALGVAVLGDAQSQLLALVIATARDLPLPDICVVLPVDKTTVPLWGTPLMALTVLSQCSDVMWLRAKSPVFSQAITRRQVRLLVPQPWSDAPAIEV